MDIVVWLRSTGAANLQILGNRSQRPATGKRFGPKATSIRGCREITRCAMSRHWSLGLLLLVLARSSAHCFICDPPIRNELTSGLIISGRVSTPM
jgi:hypothetical protein